MLNSFLLSGWSKKATTGNLKTSRVRVPVRLNWLASFLSAKDKFESQKRCHADKPAWHRAFPGLFAPDFLL